VIFKRTTAYWSVAATLIVCISMTVYFCTKVATAKSMVANPQLPPDMEMMINGFEFDNYINDHSTIHIKAKSYYRRGNKIHGFRSNVVKINIFEELAGTLKAQKSEVNFASDHGEWDFMVANTLLLTGNVALLINNKKIPVSQVARVRFDSNIIEVDNKRTYRF